MYVYIAHMRAYAIYACIHVYTRIYTYIRIYYATNGTRLPPKSAKRQATSWNTLTTQLRETVDRNGTRRSPQSAVRPAK